MRGQVLGVDPRSGEGLVAGQDGQRYRFAPEDWAHRGEPAIGIESISKPPTIVRSASSRCRPRLARVARCRQPLSSRQTTATNMSLR